MTKLLPVECGGCGWTGKRKPGNLVQCPKCGGLAAFQSGWDALHGVAPEATGTVSSEAFIRSQRDEWERNKDD